MSCSLAPPNPIVIYDPGFEGFLSAVFETTRLHLIPARLQADLSGQTDLLLPHWRVHADPIKARRVWQGLQRRGGNRLAYLFRDAFLSEQTDIDNFLWRFQQRLFRDPSVHLSDLNDESARVVWNAAKTLRREAHRLLGLVRFSPGPEETYCAAIEPIGDILEIIAPHFVKRYQAMNWLIADLKRSKAIHYRRGSLRPLAIQVDPAIFSAPDPFRDLWKGYYQAIHIPERRNPALLRRCMPLRYWSHLPERQP